MDCVVWTLQTSLTIFNLSEEKLGYMFNLRQKELFRKYKYGPISLK